MHLNIYIAARSPDDWKAVRADPDRHWKNDRSAELLASAWHGRAQMPVEVERLLWAAFGQLDPVLAIPAFEVSLPGEPQPTHTDLLVVARRQAGLVAISVEAHVDETFGETVRERLANASIESSEHVDYVLAELGLTREEAAPLRYPLLHIAVAALIAARQFHARDAVVLIHAFAAEARGWEDFYRFCASSSIEPTRGRLHPLPRSPSPRLWIGWVESQAPVVDDVRTAHRSELFAEASDDAPSVRERR